MPLQINAENLNAMISEAVKITWKMVTLVPPAFIHFPEVFIEDWMEKKLSLWDQEAPDNPTVFSQPVFLYNALGQIGQKAVVGNKLSSKDMEVVNGIILTNYYALCGILHALFFLSCQRRN